MIEALPRRWYADWALAVAVIVGIQQTYVHAPELEWYLAISQHTRSGTTFQAEIELLDPAESILRREGRCPDISELGTGDAVRDVMGDPFGVRCDPDGTVVIMARGEDGVFGTADDVDSTGKGVR